MLPDYVFGKLNATKMQRRRAGVDIIDLGMGNPNDPTPQPVIDKLIEAVQDPRNHRYSVAADGIRNLKREVGPLLQARVRRRRSTRRPRSSPPSAARRVSRTCPWS